MFDFEMAELVRKDCLVRVEIIELANRRNRDSTRAKKVAEQDATSICSRDDPDGEIPVAQGNCEPVAFSIFGPTRLLSQSCVLEKICG